MIANAPPVDDGNCVGCGPDSAIGLRMQFVRNADGSVGTRSGIRFSSNVM